METISFKGVKAVLFDLEGTLVDFQWNLKGAVQETLQKLNALGFPVDRLQGKKYSVLKNQAMAMASEIGKSPEQVKEEIDSIYDRFDAENLLRWSLRPKVKEFLSCLKTSDIRTGLVSNVGKKAIEEGIQKLGLSSLLNILVSRNDVRHLKPNGEGIRLALKHLNIPKEKALFVGDSIDDIEAAKEAGLRVIIILGGENPRPDLLAGGPDFLIQNYGELITCLKGDQM
ncbi:MAG: HAD family hydrolase [Deltaproteobacteria bacterium]|nr:HAD family hydrolase [Deltaproteobacteria bacterium]